MSSPGPEFSVCQMARGVESNKEPDTYFARYRTKRGPERSQRVSIGQVTFEVWAIP
jgi:hypothetical protein